MEKPLYSLRELMYAKYGESRFALGCEIVARWVSVERGVKTLWDAEKVLKMCNTGASWSLPLYPAEAEALRKLFGLASTEQLYTKNKGA